jgi:hypothetical protein
LQLKSVGLLLLKRATIVVPACKMSLNIKTIFAYNHNSPILTYNFQGVAKDRCVKWQHAIAYTTQEPSPAGDEMPEAGEYGMMSSIRVKARSRQEKLHKMSRINFAKMYTVEHNVKVYDFGDVHEDYIKRLKEQWKYVLLHEGQGHPSEQVAAQPVAPTQSSSATSAYAHPVASVSPYTVTTNHYGSQSYVHPHQQSTHQATETASGEGDEGEEEESEDDDESDDDDDNDDDHEDEED